MQTPFKSYPLLTHPPLFNSKTRSALPTNERGSEDSTQNDGEATPVRFDNFTSTTHHKEERQITTRGQNSADKDYKGVVGWVSVSERLTAGLA